MNNLSGLFKSIFFIHNRIGKDGIIFEFYKFRTMYLCAEKDQQKYRHLNEADGPVFKIRNDPRFTKFGKWLAWSGLDELPQIVNVLKGEMALVGPWPLPPEEEKQILRKWRFKRRSVRPGLTSSWFVKGGHKLSFAEWMKADMEDIRRKSFWYDSGIVLKTILAAAGNLIWLILTMLHFGNHPAAAGVIKGKIKNNPRQNQIKSG